jgi:hypothetical protein
MGIPYSKQINLAFDQVTPLVAAGFKVLQTTKNITFLLAAIQILTTFLLSLILLTLLGLIITVSPDLEYERQILVTPMIRWFANSAMQWGRWLKVGVWIAFVGTGVGAVGGWYATRSVVTSADLEEAESADNEVEGN